MIGSIRANMHQNTTEQDFENSYWKTDKFSQKSSRFGKQAPDFYRLLGEFTNTTTVTVTEDRKIDGSWNFVSNS